MFHHCKAHHFSTSNHRTARRYGTHRGKIYIRERVNTSKILALVGTTHDNIVQNSVRKNNKHSSGTNFGINDNNGACGTRQDQKETNTLIKYDGNSNSDGYRACQCLKRNYDTNKKNKNQSGANLSTCALRKTKLKIPMIIIPVTAMAYILLTAHRNLRGPSSKATVEVQMLSIRLTTCVTKGTCV